MDHIIMHMFSIVTEAFVIVKEDGLITKNQCSGFMDTRLIKTSSTLTYFKISHVGARG